MVKVKRKNKLKTVNQIEKNTRLMLRAGGLFARYGYYGATVALISESMGWCKANLYSYYTHKNDLFETVCNYHFNHFPVSSPVNRMLYLQLQLYRASLKVEFFDYDIKEGEEKDYLIFATKPCSEPDFYGVRK